MLSRSRLHPVPGVIFVEDFDAEAFSAQRPSLGAGEEPAPSDAPVGPAPPDPQQPTIDLEQIKAQAWEAGFDAGLKSAEESTLAERVAALERIASELAVVPRAVRLTVEHDLDCIAHAALSLLVECLPAFCRRHGTDEMLTLVRSLLPTLVDEPKVTVTVGGECDRLVRDEIERLRDQAPGLIVITSCGEMLPGDVRLTWQDGTASRDVRRLRAQMLERLIEAGLLEANVKEPRA